MQRLSIVLLIVCGAMQAQSQKYGVGRAADEKEIRRLGISVGLDGDGVVRNKAQGLKTNGPKQDEAVVVGVVPLDSRQSLYLAGGDWFPGACLACCGFLFLTGLGSRWLPRASSR